MSQAVEQIEIREVNKIEEFRRCVEIQREAFHLPDLELSPLRHFILSNKAGGFVLGAFAGEKLIGFVHHLVAARAGEVIGYSHMTAIAAEFQNSGLGARLKWAQRETALRRNVKFIKWTFDPMQSRNAHFNLNRLGAVIRRYAPNYYGTDYTTASEKFGEPLDLPSDRLFAEWELDSARVAACSETGEAPPFGKVKQKVEIPANWRGLLERDTRRAREELLRVRNEFQTALAQNLICAGFERGENVSRYLFFQA